MIPFPEKIERMVPPDVADPEVARAILTAIAFSAAAIALGAALALLFFTGSAAAFSAALPPRDAIQNDVVFGSIAFAILLVAAAALYFHALRRNRPHVTQE
jgi:hypothetical protein